MRLEVCKGKIRDADTKQTVSAKAVVALVGTLQRRLDEEGARCDSQILRAEEAERVVGTLQQERDDARTAWEAVRQSIETGEDWPLLRRAVAAEAALATTRQALADIDVESRGPTARAGKCGQIARRALADTGGDTAPVPSDSPFRRPAIQDHEAGLFGMKTYPGAAADGDTKKPA